MFEHNRKRVFLKTEYRLFDLIGDYDIEGEVKKIDYLSVLIISRVLDFTDNGLACYITNQQLAEIFNTSERTIKRKLKDLIDLGILVSDVTLITGQGQKTRQRILNVNNAQIGMCFEMQKKAKK